MFWIVAILQGETVTSPSSCIGVVLDLLDTLGSLMSYFIIMEKPHSGEMSSLVSASRSMKKSSLLCSAFHGE